MHSVELSLDGSQLEIKLDELKTLYLKEVLKEFLYEKHKNPTNSNKHEIQKVIFIQELHSDMANFTLEDWK